MNHIKLFENSFLQTNFRSFSNQIKRYLKPPSNHGFLFQHELEDAANKPSTDSGSEENTPNQSLAQMVYSDNRFPIPMVLVLSQPHVLLFQAKSRREPRCSEQVVCPERATSL